MQDWLKRVDLPYHSPHKFRHGHAVYALKNAKDISALKAVSQNLMHKNLSVTDGVYGILSEIDVRKQITQMGTDASQGLQDDELYKLLETLLERRKKASSEQT